MPFPLCWCEFKELGVLMICLALLGYLEPAPEAVKKCSEEAGREMFF